jgi:hypothetical protein
MRMTTKKLLSALFLLFLGFIQLSLISFAQPALATEDLLKTQEGFQGNEIQSAFGKDKPDDIRYTVVRVIMITLSVIGIIFVVLLVLAGFKYMTAAGNEEKVKDAVKQITQATIGLFIILSAWSISYFILTRIRAAISGTNL